MKRLPELTHEHRLARKKAVDSIRGGIIHAGNPDVAIILGLVSDIQTGKMVLNYGSLFPLVSALRASVNDLVDPQWLYTKGLNKALTIKIPGAVIISSSIKINPEFQNALDGCIYAEDGRALFFFSDSVLLCNISSCQPNQLAESTNPIAFEKLGKLYTSKGYSQNPHQALKSLLDQARGLNGDYDDANVPEFDSDEGEGRFFDTLPELVSSLAWQEWLTTASQAEIEREIRDGNPYLLGLLEVSDDETTDEKQKKPNLTLVK